MVLKIKRWFRDKKGAFLAENLGWLILAVIVIAISFMGYLIATGKASGAIAYVKNIFRFG